MMQMSYEQYQNDILIHRKKAIESAKREIANDLRLELVALKEIAMNCTDLRTQNQLLRRLQRLENIYNYYKGGTVYVHN